MPYIHQRVRRDLLAGRMKVATPGELNYSITCTIMEYLDNMGLSYQHINDVIGALECAKAEFQRRIVAPYEDQKCAENGDVY